MQILILNYEYPPLGGGAGVIAKAHAHYLSELGHFVEVVTCSSTGVYYEELISNKLKVNYLNSYRKHPFQSGMLEKLDWIKKANSFVLQSKYKNFDFCMAHFTIPGGLVAMRLKKRYGVPFGVVSHGQDVPWFYPKQMFFYHLISYVTIKRILINASILWVQSKMMHKNATRFLKGKGAKIELIANGCSKEYEAKSLSVKSDNEELQILFAGRLTKQKRPDKLIKAAFILKEAGYKFKLYIAGDGPLMSKLSKMVSSLHLESEVIFTGLLSREKLKKFYTKCHVLLAPSESEGMSISMLEALFSGLYLICTNVSGAEELIEEGINGKIVSGSPQSIAAAIMKTNWNQIATNESMELHKQIVEQFNWLSIAKQYEKSIIDAL